MQLPNFLDHQGFNQLRRAMGAPLSRYRARIDLPQPTRSASPEAPVPALPIEGLVIQNWNDEITILQDGTLAQNGRRILVYIRDYGNFEPRFHLANCDTILSMRENDRFGRYVSAEGTDGLFFVRRGNATLRPMRLSVCQHCLDKLQWHGFSSSWSNQYRNNAVKNFSVNEFFEKFPKSLFVFDPEHDARTAPNNEYPINWSEISDAMRQACDYTCEQCGVRVLQMHYRIIHVHHVNGLKYDCGAENLKCLCIRCHAKQPKHEAMRTLPDFGEFCQLYPTEGI